MPMANIWTFIFVLLSALPLRAVGHSDHHTPQNPVDPSEWSQRLTDFRLYGDTQDLEVAKLILRSLSVQDASNEQLYLAAQTAQADHRFVEAIELLDRLLARTPNNDVARLMRANTLVTVGQSETAHLECDLLQKMPMSVVLACRLMSAAEPDAGSLSTLLDKVSAVEANQLPPQLLAWVLAVLGDHALTQNRTGAALGYFKHAYQLDPLASYQITYVEALLRAARCEDALSITAQFHNHLAMRVKHAIATRQCGRPDLSLESRLTTTFDHEVARADFTHGREMAEYHLFVTKNTSLARHILTSSLSFQHTAEDERLWRLAHAE